MLLDEDPATLIHHTIGNFNIQPDRLAVARINESLSTLQQARDLRIREAESALKKLSRTLTALNSQHTDLLSTHSSQTHASEIATLDTSKFRIAKSASDLEIETERLSSTLLDLQSRLTELELQGLSINPPNPAKQPLVDDAVNLRLKVYRSLGATVDGRGGMGGNGNGVGGEGEAKEKEGVFNRVVLRNVGGRGEVHIVRVEKERYSRAFYAGYLWDRM